MSRSDNLYELPKDLPVPVDDGACDHPAGMHVPSMILKLYNVELSAFSDRSEAKS